jgi:hypothetical protein
LPIGFLHALETALQDGGGKNGKKPVSHVGHLLLSGHDDKAKEADLKPVNKAFPMILSAPRTVRLAQECEHDGVELVGIP